MSLYDHRPQLRDSFLTRRQMLQRCGMGLGALALADLLKSTARQILLQRALSLPTPACFHTQLVRDEQGTRLAKRHDVLAIRTLRQQGLTPADVIEQISCFTQRK